MRGANGELVLARMKWMLQHSLPYQRDGHSDEHAFNDECKRVVGWDRGSRIEDSSKQDLPHRSSVNVSVSL